MFSNSIAAFGTRSNFLELLQMLSNFYTVPTKIPDGNIVIIFLLGKSENLELVLIKLPMVDFTACSTKWSAELLKTKTVELYMNNFKEASKYQTVVVFNRKDQVFFKKDGRVRTLLWI
jgi:hypothetical protein